MPKQDPLELEETVKRPTGPCVIIIFGAAGDLTKRKLIPALYNLSKDGLLPQEFAVVGVTKRDMTDEAYRAKMSQDIREFATEKVDRTLWQWLEQRLYNFQGDFLDPAAYGRLQTLLAQIDKEHGTGGNYLFYLATSPSFFGEIVR
jgi:glucose-6-phosphate 1-dehydrogenase